MKLNESTVETNPSAQLIITPKSKDVACQLLKFKNNYEVEKIWDI